MTQLLRVQEETKLSRREAAYLITIFNDTAGKRTTMKRHTFCTVMTAAYVVPATPFIPDHRRQPVVTCCAAGTHG